MSELRFIERDGKRVLQQRTSVGMAGELWQDVPLVSDPPKSRRQEKRDELAKHLEKMTIQMMYGKGVVTNEQLAEAALEWVESQLHYHPSEGTGAAPSWFNGYSKAMSDVRKNLGLDQ